MYMLKSVGDSTPPCGTPFLNWRCADVFFLNMVYALRPLMWFAMYLIMVCVSTKRIQPAHGWCATVKRDCKLYPPYPASQEARAPVFWGSQSCDPACSAPHCSTLL